MDPVADFLANHLHAGQTAFDIGANRGDYSRLMAALVGPSGRVEAFEPNPEAAAPLPAGVNVHLVAVSDVDTPARDFFVDTRPEGLASSFAQLDGLETRTIRVPTVTLDGFCASTRVVPDLVKIDTEGHELEVIRGGAQMVARRRPVIVFEFWQTWWDRGVSRIFDVLRPGYRLTLLQTGEDVTRRRRWGTAEVDIGCVPRRLPRRLRVGAVR